MRRYLIVKSLANFLSQPALSRQSCIDLSLVSRVCDFDRFHQRQLNVLRLLLLQSGCIIVYLRCRRRRNSVHRGTSRRTRSDVLVALFRRSCFPPQPDVTQCLRRCHTFWRLPDQTSLDKVDKCRLVAVSLQSSRERPGRRRTAVLPTPGTPTDNLLATVWAFRNGAVARDSLGADKVPCTFARG